MRVNRTRAAARRIGGAVAAVAAIVATGVAAALAGAGAAVAQPAYPTRPVTIVVPYQAGGGTDIVARALARSLEKQWGQAVVVENLAGADGIIGTQRVLRAPPDGHTLLLQLNTMLLWKLSETTGRDLVGDLRFVSLIQTAPLAFAVSADFPATTMKEFVAHCRAAPKPCTIGTATRYAQLISRHLLDAVGLPDAITVPYKGGGPMVTDLLGGHVSMAVPSVASAQRAVAAGRMRLLAVGSTERFPLAPSVPTLAESGWEVFGDSWYGLMTSKEVPGPVFDAIVRSIRVASQDRELVSTIEANGGAPVFGTPEAFDEYARRERAYLNRLVAKYPTGGP